MDRERRLLESFETLHLCLVHATNRHREIAISRNAQSTLALWCRALGIDGEQSQAVVLPRAEVFRLYGNPVRKRPVRDFQV